MHKKKPIIPGTIIFIAPFYNRSGFAVGARTTAISLHNAGIPVKIIYVNEIEPGIDDCDLDLLKKLENTPVVPPVTTLIFHVPSKEWLKFRLPEPNLFILATAFDCSDPSHLPPKEWLEIFAAMDQIWVQSHKEYNAFLKAGLSRDKLKLVFWPHPWKGNRILPPAHERKSTPKKAFRFLSIAMFQPRRRWDSLIEAYLEEFKNEDNVELYLKVSYPKWHESPGQPCKDLHNLISSLRLKSDSNATIIVDEKLGSRKELVELIDSCDTYISTDTSATAPVAEARSRKRLVIVPFGVNHSRTDIQIEIAVDSTNKIPVSEEMSLYKHNKKGESITKLFTKDVQLALRKAFTIHPNEKERICQNSFCYIPGPIEAIPKIINAINAGWKLKQSLKKSNQISNFRSQYHNNTAINISWEGSFFVHNSLALVNREMIYSLIDKELNISLIPYEKDQFLPDNNHYINKIIPLLHRNIDKVDIHIRHHWPPNLDSPPESSHWVNIQPWEFGSLPKEWVKKFQEEIDECWVPSNYVRQVYINSGVDKDRVFVIPNGINPSVFNPQVPPTPIESQKKFKFLFVGGTIHRKGIDILLRSYSKIFSNNEDVTLVIKDFGGDSFYQGQTIAEHIKKFQDNEQAPEIIYINQTLPETELAGLYTACDVLVHPYRGEGFGLPILEAMACGMPVIVTNGGAALDFCKPSFSLLINAKKAVKSYNYVGNLELVDNAWLYEPDPNDLAKKMLYAYRNPVQMKELGQQAHIEAHNYWKWKDTGKKIYERILQLKDKPIQRELHETKMKKRSTEQKLSTDLKMLKQTLEKEPGDIETLKKLTELYIGRNKS